MIKFFRRIRQRLITEGRLSKYFLYALGEVALVMIGILLALQVNNWNETRKSKALETQYLNRLMKDLRIDTTYYAARMQHSGNAVERNRNVMKSLYDKQGTLEEVKGLISQVWWSSEQLTTQNATYLELSNSGNLSILRKIELKELIVQYYRKTEEISKHVAEFDEVSTRFLTNVFQVIPTMVKFYHPDVYGDMEVDKQEWAFMNDPASNKFQTFEASIAFYKIKHNKFYSEFEILKKQSSTLLQEIQTELDLIR